MISRTVHGRPDDGQDVVRTSTAISSNPPNPPSEEDIETFYISLISSIGTADAEPDEFFVTAPGLSTKLLSMIRA